MAKNGYKQSINNIFLYLLFVINGIISWTVGHVYKCSCTQTNHLLQSNKILLNLY